MLAYALVITMTSGITILIMSGVEGPSAIPAEPSFYAFWTIFAGALGGGVGVFAARGWMGRPGALGLARAFVGCIAVAVVAAVVAGNLILPVYGTFYAPVLLVSVLISKPWLAVVWIAALTGAHYLMIVTQQERALGYGRGTDQRATSYLSKLSQAQLYQRPID